MAITTITQNWKTKYKYGSQLFSSMSWAQRAMARISKTRNSTWTILPTQWKTKQQVLDTALKSWMVKMDWTKIVWSNWQVVWDTTKFNLNDMAW